MVLITSIFVSLVALMFLYCHNRPHLFDTDFIEELEMRCNWHTRLLRRDLNQDEYDAIRARTVEDYYA